MLVLVVLLMKRFPSSLFPVRNLLNTCMFRIVLNFSLVTTRLVANGLRAPVHCVIWLVTLALLKLP